MISTTIRRSLPVIALVMIVATAAPASAQTSLEDHTYQVSLFGGLGGALDNGGGLDESTFQLGFSVVTTSRGRFGIRYGSHDFTTNTIPNGSLDYITLGGEYRFAETLYDSGLFIGLGLYDQQGFDTGSGSFSDSSVGIVIGVTGEFEMARGFSVLVELMGHVVPSSPSEIFANALVGVAYKF